MITLLLKLLQSLCPRGQSEKGQPNVDMCVQEGEGSKITENVWTSFMKDPSTI